MFPNEAGRQLIHWLTLTPLAQTQIVVPLSGVGLLVILMALGAYWGYQLGFRNLITIALWTIVGYIFTVQGGTIIVDIINRFWQNGPRLAAFAIGRDPGGVTPLEPLITTDFQVPLFFRFVAFVVLVLLGFFFNQGNRSGWKGSPNEPLAKPLGLFVGALILLLWTNAAVVFWEEYLAGGGGFGGPIAQVLNILPNVSVLMPSLIAIFFLIIIVLIVFNFPKVWSPGGGGKK
jgi:hypothetical protein